MYLVGEPDEDAVVSSDVLATPCAGLPLAPHGLLTDDDAVFGGGGPVEPPPAWVTCRGDVAQRILRKPPDPYFDSHVWYLLATIAGICRRLDPTATDDDTDDDTCTALIAAVAAKELLPRPPASRRSHDTVASAASPRLVWAWLYKLWAATSRLTDAIDDPLWTDPRALAGWVDDAVVALRGYQQARINSPTG